MFTHSRHGPSSKSSSKFLFLVLASLLLIEHIGAANLHLSSRNKRSDYEDDYDEFNENNSSSDPGDSESVEFDNNEAGSEKHRDHATHDHEDHAHEKEEESPPLIEQEDDLFSWDGSEEDTADDDSKIHNHPIHQDDHHSHHAHHPSSTLLKIRNESLPIASNPKTTAQLVPDKSPETKTGDEHDHHHHHHHHHSNPPQDHPQDKNDQKMDVSHHPSPSSKEGVLGKGKTFVVHVEETNASFHIWLGAGLVALLIGIAIAIMVVLNNVRKRKYGRVLSA